MKVLDLIFDLDGTLSNPAEGFVRSINYALRQHGLAERDEEDLNLLIGPPLDEAFRAVIDMPETQDVSGLVYSYRERYSAVGYTENVLYEGIPDALSGFKGRGMSLGVCTSKRTDFAELILEKFGIRSAFEFVRRADIGIPKRQQLADLLSEGLVSARSVMIGDRAVDITAARANSIRTAGVLYGYGSTSEISDAMPDWIIDVPASLVSTLG